jgi:hypothetical protein
MMRSLFRLSIPLLLIFTTSILLIHAQPYDDAQLRTFLTPPEDCDAPCFMGIRPGLMTIREGAARLQSGNGFASVRAVSFQLYEVHFADGTAPIEQARVYMVAAPDVSVARVNLFDSGLPLSRFILAFGKPERLIIYNTLRRNVVTYVAFYLQKAVYVLVDLQLCSVGQTMLWSNRRDVTIGIGFWDDEGEQPDYYLQPIEIRPDAWAKTLRDIKRERCP